jgi:hypothetical protein
VSELTFGQRLAVRVLAWAMRRRGMPAALELQRALDRAFPHRTWEQRAAMWNAAVDRAGSRR